MITGITKANKKNRGIYVVFVLVIFVFIGLFSNRSAHLKNFGSGTVISSGPRKPRHPPRLRLSSSQLIAKTTRQNSLPILTSDCDNWVVTSSKNISHTDFGQSLNGRRIQPSWCIVIVGDEFDTDNEWNVSLDNAIFLSAEQQAAIDHPFVQHVLSTLRRQPNNPFLRRNIGYLFAIKHGAKAIYDAYTADFDHDINFHSPPGAFRFFQGRNRVMVKYSENNEMSPSTFLLDQTWSFGSLDYASLGITFPLCLDMDHHQSSSFKSGTRFLAPIQNYTHPTFNSVTFFHRAFWGLFLPATVPQIFRSLLAQKFLHELNLGVILEETLTGQECHSLGRPEVNASDFIEYLVTKEAFVYPMEEANTNLASRIEYFFFELLENGYVGIDDVYSVQEWLLALIDAGYEFPSLNSTTVEAHGENATSNSSRLPSLAVTREPSLEGQPYLASPAFNADLDGHRYEEFLLASGNKNGSMEMFHEWLDRPKLFPHPETDPAILKIVVMTKDEGSLLQDWVVYHGELVGFENLYIIDGSSDQDSINFLIHARKHWGVNVIFSSAGLDRLEGLLSAVGREISRASDFVVKMDTDEFLVANKRDSTCIHSAATDLPDGLLSSNCTLSPYAVQNFLDQLRNSSTGDRLRFGYIMSSQASAAVCENDDSKNDIASFPLGQVVEAGWFKSISDARTLTGIDLGGHNNYFAPPFGKIFGDAVDIGALHFHIRCLETEVANCRKALVSHKYIQESDSEEMAKERLFQLQKEWGNPVERDGFCDVKVIYGSSYHKITFYMRYLMGCVTAENFYPSAEGTQQNPDFVNFLKTARRHRGHL